VYLRINGELHSLWRAVDQHGGVLDILIQNRRNALAAKRFFKYLPACGTRRGGSAPMAFAATALCIARSCPTSGTGAVDPSITGPDIRIGWTAGGSGRCSASNRSCYAQVFSDLAA
jgi:DDE domain